MSRVADLLGDTDRATLLRYMMAMHQKDHRLGDDLLHDGLRRWPESVPLLYASAASPFTELDRGSASRDADTSAARLTGEPALVIDLTRAAAQQQWARVAAADDRLATVDWTAQWGLQAAQLRAEWRIRVTSPELRQQFGDQGIAIADRAEVSQPDFDWHALRAWSAAGTNRPEVMVESVAMFCVTAEQIRATLAPAEIKALRDRAVGLVGVVAQLTGDSRVDAQRLTSVRNRLTKVVQSLQ
jgi:hypothetical protein